LAILYYYYYYYYYYYWTSNIWFYYLITTHCLHILCMSFSGLCSINCPLPEQWYSSIVCCIFVRLFLNLKTSEALYDFAPTVKFWNLCFNENRTWLWNIYLRIWQCVRQSISNTNELGTMSSYSFYIFSSPVSIPSSFLPVLPVLPLEV